MHLGAAPPYLCLLRRKFCAAGGRSSFVTAVRFLNVQEVLSLSTAAQNIPVFLRKSLLHKKHFFGWLKTANISIVCGTVTLKSLLPQAFAVSNVHPRLRKRLARCTLDCGSKTSESPALRGFVAERCPITGTSLYLVLKSNDLPRPKIRLKKFGFSPIDTPANIAKKLPPQRCFKPLLIALFNFSHKRLTFAFTGENGYTAETGAFPSAGTAWLCAANRIALNAAFATPDSTVLLYTYISRFSVNPQHQQKRIIRQSCCHKFYPQTAFHRAFQLLAQTPHICFHERKRVHTRLCSKDRTQGHTRRNRWCFGWGVVSLPSERSARFGNPAWPGGRTANFAAFGPWSGVLSKNTESLRNSDALMRVAVPKASRPRWAA